MTEKHKHILQDAVENVLLSLPVAHIAKLHSCSRQYVSKLMQCYGIIIDRNNGTLTVSITTLKQLQKGKNND